MIERLPSKHVVLLGIGHTNAHVVRMWGMNPIPDASLTCVSNHTVATYSGMLPAALAGQIPQAAMEIDLVRLCNSVGARLITDDVTGIDRANGRLLFDDRPAIPYDALSIGIGSVPIDGELEAGEQHVLRIKPMQTFMERLARAIDDAIARTDRKALRIAIVGAGVAGIEISFCLPTFVEQQTGAEPSITLITRSDDVLPDVAESTRRRVAGQLRRRGVTVHTRKAVAKVTDQHLTLDDGQQLEADLVVWATGATAPPLLSRLGLPVDDRGFLETDATLQSTAGGNIFAVGDTGTIANQKLPKAGVYAVRQGPILWDNLQRGLSGRPLVDYQPQTSFMKLINLGNGDAIGQWKGFSFQGQWVMRMKDRIDTRFMEMYQPLSMTPDGTTGQDDMQCRGCGCKLGGDLLEEALQSDQPIQLEDAAPIGRDDQQTLIASTDFFTSPVDDAYLTGRVAALHSASDIIATGARPTKALANVVLPEGNAATQRQMLSDFLAGAREEFGAMGAEIVGGHTIVGPRFEVGFTVIGRSISENLLHKDRLRVGDKLLLTKPIGIGVLLAAHMRSLCPAAGYTAAITTMLERQHELAGLAVTAGVCAGTDITGFGLGGHLIEMLETGNVAAEISLASIPTLIGATQQVEAGIESTLAPQNRRIDRKIKADITLRDQAVYKLLFDPQTCGGLLLGVAADACEDLANTISKTTGIETAVIGDVTQASDQTKRLTVNP